MAARPISGPELRARRLALGLGQGALADALGVAQVTISRWESGTRAVGTTVDAELTALEDRLEQAVLARLAAGIDTYTTADGQDLAPTDAVAAARAASARRRVPRDLAPTGEHP